jgi:hypothetical protein
MDAFAIALVEFINILLLFAYHTIVPDNPEKFIRILNCFVFAFFEYRYNGLSVSPYQFILFGLFYSVCAGGICLLFSQFQIFFNIVIVFNFMIFCINCISYICE